MGVHTRHRRDVIARAGALACAAAGPLAAGAVLLLADALGGIVEMPGDAVTYTAYCALLVACLEVPLVLRLAGRVSAPGMTAVAGGLAPLAVAAGGLVPNVPAFASAMVLAGLLGGPLLVLPRALLPAGLAAWWHLAALAGVAGAAFLAVARANAPGDAVAVAGVLAAVLGVGAICVPKPVREAPDSGLPTSKGRPPAAGAVSARALGLREAFALALPALPGYATAAGAVAVTVQSGLHLLLFRWNLVGGAPALRLAWAALAAVVLTVLARNLAGATWPVPWLLLMAATAPVLVATAPAGWALAASFTVVLAAAALAAASLDGALIARAPAAQRPGLAGVTAAVSVTAALAALGVMALIGKVTDDVSAATLMAVPLAAGAFAASGTAVKRPGALPAAEAGVSSGRRGGHRPAPAGRARPVGGPGSDGRPRRHAARARRRSRGGLRPWQPDPA
ncbi:hypothetical protein ACFQHO_01660 [Actinomadura yumaensis]|uniref:hypothetical protein n=1 Tax=Actinomadura yumaensis TaxID=111807 RepID=UPI00361CCA71